MIERRRYRKISTRIWGDEKFCKLSKPKPNAQTLWFYLLTGPHTNVLPGLFTAGEAGLAEALKWPLGEFRRCFTELQDASMALADWEARVVWLPKAVHHNAPESPNVVKSWKTALDEIPECRLKRVAAQGFKDFLEALPEVLGEGKGKSFLKALGEGWPALRKTDLDHPSPNQEQEQEQEQEQSTAREARKADADRELGTGPFVRRFCDLYAKYQSGARYHVVASKHIPLVRGLLRTHGRERLEKLAIVMLTATADAWLNETDRGLEVLNGKINWLERRLAQYEAEHGEIRIAS